MFVLNRLYNMDCMEAMRGIPDKYFQLAIVDPPYGGGVQLTSATGLQGGHNEKWNDRERGRFGARFDKYHISKTDRGNMVEEIPNRGLP